MLPPLSSREERGLSSRGPEPANGPAKDRPASKRGSCSSHARLAKGAAAGAAKESSAGNTASDERLLLLLL